MPVKFDDGDIQSLNGVGIDDSNSVIGIVHTTTIRLFLQQLRRAKHVTLGVPFYQDGEQIMEFDTAGLVWAGNTTNPVAATHATSAQSPLTASCKYKFMSQSAACKKKWHYGSGAMKKTGVMRKWAMANSTNEISLASPYFDDGRGTAFFLLSIDRTFSGPSGYYDEVRLVTLSGQVFCDQHGICTLHVKFDDGSEETVDAVETEIPPLQTIAVTNPDAVKLLIQKIKKAKYIRIGVLFFGNGEQIMEFDTAGLIWEGNYGND